MKNKYLNILLIFILGCFSSLNGQQTTEFGFLRENIVLINPAFFNYSFIEDNSVRQNITAYHKQQWLDTYEGPVISNVRFEKISVQEGSFPVRPKIKWGFGVEQNNLANGRYKELGISFNYGYHLNLSDQLTLTSGLLVKGLQDSYNVNPNSLQHEDDEVFLPGNNWSGMIDLGIVLRKKVVIKNSSIESWYLGLSGNQVRGVSFNKLGLVDSRPMQLNLILGCFMGRDLTGNGLLNYLEPMVLVRYIPPFNGEKFEGFLPPFLGGDFKIPFNIDFNVRYSRRESFFIGTGLGWAGNINFETGYQFKDISGMNKMKYKIGILGNMPVFNFNFIKNNKQYFLFPSAELFFSVSLGRN